MKKSIKKLRLLSIEKQRKFCIKFISLSHTFDLSVEETIEALDKLRWSLTVATKIVSEVENERNN